MRYKILVFGIIFFICIIVLMEADRSIASKILGVSDHIKLFFLNTKDNITSTYDKHFNQAKTIEELRLKTSDYDKLVLEVEELKNNLSKFQNLVGKRDVTQISPEIHLARIISYAGLGERTKVWLDTDLRQYRDYRLDGLEDRIFGIVKDNMALGIAVVKDGRVEGFLNGDEKCNYDVYIGNNRAMGIVSGMRNDRILVNFIPDWIEIRKGDKVFTSGLDGIFLENIPVGVVEDVREDYGYLSVDVKPFVQMDSLSYVWLIDREQPKMILQYDEIEGDVGDEELIQSF